jgi:protoheme IX farnesyltransferase
MRRTANRPLPADRVALVEAAIWGTLLAIAGLLILHMGSNRLATALTAITFASYIGIYTPLKTKTTLNTVVGAIPGALPPAIGWAAATGRCGAEAWALFLILFLWQFPHFLAIAWLHRADYGRAGFQMLPLHDPSGAITGRQATWAALCLVPTSLLPAVVGLAGTWYFVGALALGGYYLQAAVQFWLHRSDAAARSLLRASFLYLPAVLLLLVLNPMPA